MQITKMLYNQIALICDTASIAVVGDNIFVVHDFLPSSSGNTSSVDFCTITGINVTEFFTLNPIDPNLNVQFIAKFLKYIEALPILRIKYNKSVEYYIYSK